MRQGGFGRLFHVRSLIRAEHAIANRLNWDNRAELHVSDTTSSYRRERRALSTAMPSSAWRASAVARSGRRLVCSTVS